MLSKKIPQKVKIVEVGPRDGLQNEKKIIETNDKFEFIQKLLLSGIKDIEIASFVKPEKIPQMSDAEVLVSQILEKIGLSKFHGICLVPNMKGLESALKLGVKDVAFFTAVSDEFNKKNINMTVDQSLKEMSNLFAEAKANKLKVRVYISTVFGCPYVGAISISDVKRVLAKIDQYGDYEVSLGDTTGVANPIQVEKTLVEVIKKHDVKKLAMHFHDTKGLALANILASLTQGVSIFDSSAGGLGGCPYARGASGNVATEDLIYLFHSMGIKTGINFDLLAQSSRFILERLGKESPSKCLNFYLKTGKI